MLVCKPKSLDTTAVQAWLPDSPRWLLFSGAPREEVFQSLSRCRGMYSNEEATEQELAKMNATAQEGPPSEGEATFETGVRKTVKAEDAVRMC